jgi:hypothetical protein
MREHTSRHSKSDNVSRNVIRLDDIVHIIIINVPPTRELNVKLAAVPLCANAIPGYKSKNSSRLEMRNIAYLEAVCSVSQAARKLQLRGSPFSRASRDAKMECAGVVRPDVRRIEEVS